jgi:hypothetical protein
VQGGDATVTLSAQADSVAGYEANITFDPESVRVTKIEPVDIEGWTTLNNTRNNDKGWIMVTGSNDTGLQDPELLNITFGIKRTTENRTALGFVNSDTQLNNESSVIDTETHAGSISILNPALFNVSIRETNSPVTTRDLLNVTVNVTNSGGVEDTQNTSLSVGGVAGRQDVNEVSLGPSKSKTETLTWDTNGTEPGMYGINVSTQDDFDTGSVSVLEEPEFGLDIVSTNKPIEGDSLNVSVNVTNTGGIRLTQDINLAIPGIGNESKSLSLDGGSSVYLNFSLVTDVGDAGNYTATVMTDSSTDSVSVTVTSSALFSSPLIDRFDDPPQNTGGLDPSLYEDLDGDGDGTEVGPAVSVFGELIRGNDLGLSDTQARKLNWNPGSPADEVTVADMVTLFGEKIRAD